MKPSLLESIKHTLTEAIECSREEYSEAACVDTDKDLTEMECNGMDIPPSDAYTPSEKELDATERWFKGEE